MTGVRFVAWAPKEWAGYNDLAWILGREGKHAEAARVIEAAFAQVPLGEENAWLWNMLGVAQMNGGDMAAARTSFARAKELAALMTETEWGKAYPGNDPSTGADGLESFRAAIERNLARAGGA